jgi:ribonuclease HI
MNNALLCSYFPADWRHAKVKVVPKPNKDNYSNPSSYRPISIVSTLSKVFEKIILTRLSWLATANNWFSDRQHGFREGKSTETAAHLLTSFVEQGFTLGHSTATAFIDFQSAFDRASHKSILAALERKQCPVYLVRIIGSFLQSRKATLSDGTNSFSVELCTGCPQGSVLSAFLWLVLVDEVLALQFDFTHLTLAYADDLTLSASHRDPIIATTNLQNICNEVAKWSNSVKLVINPQKTTFMIFSRSRARPMSLSLLLEGITIAPVHEAHFLGLLLDQRLSWFPHVRNKCLNVKKLTFAIKRHLSATWGLSKSVLRKLYFSTIEPTLLYGCSVWCPVVSQTRAVATLRSTQRLVMQIMLRTFKSTSTEACLVLSGLIPIELRIMELAASRFIAIRAPFSPRASQTIKTSFPSIDLSQSVSLPTRFFSTDHPPWLCPQLPPLIILPPEVHLPLLPLVPGTLRVYTDGSVIGGCTGYGLLVCNFEGIVATCRGKLPEHCSIFQAEGNALLQALRFASTMSPHPERIEIFADSRAALMASLTTEKISSPFVEIRTMLLSLPTTAQLFWIASHRGHPGNEIADTLAKQGALGPGAQTDALPTPIACLRLALRRATSELWARKWSTAPKASITRSFFPTIVSATVITNMDLPCYVAQLLSGHSRLRAFLYKTNCTQSPTCMCGSDEETVYHFLFHCSLHDPHRANFKDTSLRVCNMWPPRLSDIARFKPLMLSFISFIGKTKQFRQHALSV